jgi:hypothetical protein
MKNITSVYFGKGGISTYESVYGYLSTDALVLRIGNIVRY